MKTRANARCTLFLVVVSVCLCVLCADNTVLHAQNSEYDEIQRLQERAIYALDGYQIDLAIQYLSQLVSLDPHSFFAHAKLAQSYFVKRDIALAATYAARAAYLKQNDLDLQILTARIHIAQNNGVRATQILSQLERTHSQNIKILLVNAELAVAEYNYGEAIRRYQSVLARDRNNIIALLGLALLREDQGDFDSAESLIMRAREQAPQQLAAYFLSAQHYYLRGQYGRAQEYINIAMQIAVDDATTQILASEIARANGEYQRAQMHIQSLIDNDGQNPQYWYMHGVILIQQSQYSEAVRSFQEALFFQRDYELARFAVEETVRQQFVAEDDIRGALASYRIQRARAFRERNLLQEARIQVLRGLQVNPLSQSGRLLRAEIEHAHGFNATYARELKLVQSLGNNSQSIADTIETVDDAISTQPAAVWGIDQFTTIGKSVKVGVVINRMLSRVMVDATLGTVGNYLLDMLGFSERIDVSRELVITNVPTAFQINEDIRTYDYVLHCFLRESHNTVQLVVALINPLNRNTIAEYRAAFVGADRYHRAVHNVVRRIESDIPLRGQIIARQQDRVLVNIGGVQGITPAEELIVVQQGALATAESALAFQFPDTSEVGRIIVDKVDDLVAEGKIMRQGLFDNFTIGDDVFIPARALPQSVPINTPSPLYDHILQIR